MADEKQTDHNLNQVWGRIDEMKSEWAETNSELSSVVSSVDDMKVEMRAMGHDLRAFVSRPPKETDYKSIVMIALIVAGMAGGLVAATIAPMRIIISKHDKQIMKELEESAIHRYSAGVRDGKLTAMETVSTKLFDDLHNRMIDLEKQGAYCRANIENNKRHIEAVDLYRSRGHTISAGAVLERVRDSK